VGNRVALATQEGGNGSFLLSPNQEQPPEGELELTCKYPAMSGVSGSIYEFSVEVRYTGEDVRFFDFTMTTPPGWRASAWQKYPEREVTGTQMGVWTAPETIKVKFGPTAGKQPEPGDYVMTFEVSSGDIKETMELKAVVTARYEFAMLTATLRLNAEVTAGEENHLSLLLVNSGSTAIENIALSSSKPGGWSITFNPEKMDSLEAGLTQEVDVVIEPPRKTIAGDYSVVLFAESKEVSDDLDIRVTVLTPTIWGWVGILIVLAIIAGLAVLFRQLGRR